MITADLPTIYLVITLIGVTMTLIVSASAVADRNGGLRPIALGLALSTLGYFLYGQRSVLSEPVFIVLANVAMAAGISCFTFAIFQFQQRSASRMVLFLPILLMGLVSSILANQMALRIGLISLLFTLQSAFLLKSLVEKRHVTVGIGQYYLMVSFALSLLVFVVRLLTALFGPTASLAVNQPGTLLTISLLIPVVSETMVAMGFIIMGKERADERNLRLAMQDELTGLANRRHVLDVLAQQLAAVTRANLPLSMLMMDIDHFKQINDRYGHPAGDEALRQVADGLRARLRAQDIAGRVGGEEFLVVLPQTSLEGALKLAESLRASIAELQLSTADGQQIVLTISIGVSTLEDMPGAQGDSLIAAADAALYRAKQNGRNRVEHQVLGSSVTANT